MSPDQPTGSRFGAERAQGRTCGECTLCCKLLAIPEIQKAAGKWCAVCNIGKACTVYENRPRACRDFECLWLQGVGTDDMRPDKSKVVMSLAPMSAVPSRRGQPGQIPVLHVDPGRPDAHRNPAFAELFSNFDEVIVAHGADGRLMKQRRT